MHVQGLFTALGAERLGDIAEIFAQCSYDLRAGWPDLTLWREGQVRFVEVKSPSDQTHASQALLISKILVPLGFDTTWGMLRIRVKCYHKAVLNGIGAGFNGAGIWSMSRTKRPNLRICSRL